MRITERFSSEHQVFLRQLAFLEASLNAPPERLAAIVLTIRDPLELHAQAEEAFLFPQLGARIGTEMGAIPVLVDEHETIQAIIARLSAAQDRQAARALVQRLIEVLRAHIEKEDEVLFPLADQFLGTEQLQDLDGAFVRSTRLAPVG